MKVPDPTLTPISGRELSFPARSEEHTSELQSQSNLVCRLLLEKKKNKCLHMHEPQEYRQISSQTSLTSHPLIATTNLINNAIRHPLYAAFTDVQIIPTHATDLD